MNDFDDGFALGYGGCCGGGLLVQLVICWFLYRCYEAVPARHRRMDSSLVWLAMIPFFHLIWNFFVFPRLSDSLCDTFGELGRGPEVGDCGRSLGIWFCVCAVGGFVPCLQWVAAPAALVLAILYLVKVLELKGRIEAMLPPENV